jgi:hypothetical protein
MIDTSLRNKIDIRYKKVWKRKQEHANEDMMNEGHPKVTLSGFFGHTNHTERGGESV